MEIVSWKAFIVCCVFEKNKAASLAMNIYVQEHT
jgi:hypothetical protein